MSAINLTGAWKLSAPERERLRQEEMRFLQRVRDNHEVRMLSAEGNDTEQALISAVVQSATEEIAKANTIIMQQQEMTVEEIIRLQALIASLIQQRQQLLDNAYVLPDGRRVFKDKNGKVFTEDGVEVGKDVVDASEISDDRTTREEYIENSQQLESAKNHLNKTFEYQKELDDIHVELNAESTRPERRRELLQKIETIKPDNIRNKEANLKPELLPEKPTGQFKIAAATTPLPSKFDLDTLEINEPGLNG